MDSTDTSDMPPSSFEEAKNGSEAIVAQVEDADSYPHGIRLFLVVTALLLSMFLIALDMTIVATAIPKITDEFHSLEDIGWYAASFFLTLAAFQSSWGKAYKYFSLKYTFMITVFIFEVGSLICGVAQNSVTLIIGRAIAGLGGAGVTGGIYTIIAYIVPPARIPAYSGLVGAVFCIASVAGPLLGGVFTGEVTWRWVFYINLPIGGFALFLLFIFFHTPTTVKPVPIKIRDLLVVMDFPGISLSLGLLICLTLAMQWGGTSKPWSSADVIGVLVGFGVMSIAFGILEWRAGDHALLVPRILKNRTIAAVTAFIFFLNGANFLIFYSLPQYFQIINGVSATDSGIRNLPLIIASAIFSLFSGFLLGRVGQYQLFLISGAALITLGAGLVYMLDMDSSIGKIIGFQIVVGAGIGICIQVPITTAQGISKPEDIPMTTAGVLFFQMVAGAIWVSGSQALLNNRMIAALAKLAPDLSPELVLATGATEIRSVFSGADLEHVMEAYMVGLKDSWILAIALSGLTFLSAFAGKWRACEDDVIVKRR